MTLSQHPHHSSRRDWMKLSAKMGLGLSAGCLGSNAQLSAAFIPSHHSHIPTAQAVIYIYCAGGLTHLDSFDPKPKRPEVQGATKVIHSKVDGMNFGHHFKNLAQQAEHLAIINSMKTTQGAHEQGNYIMHTSYEMRSTIKHPTMGSWASKILGAHNPSLPSSVIINGPSQYPGAGYWESAHTPLQIDDPLKGLSNIKDPKDFKADRLKRRFNELQDMNARFLQRYNVKAVRAYHDMNQDAVELMNSRDLIAFDITKEPQKVRQQYGENRTGNSMLLARRLVEHGVRHIEINLGGWDFHNDNFGQMDDKAPSLDQALGSLIADLQQRGMLSTTLVALGTEFGRTPTLNNNKFGRDHHPQAFSTLLAGGGIKGGTVFGKSDERGEQVVENVVQPTDFNATIAHAMGMPTDKIFHSPSGRPFQIAHKGRVIHELFS